jgi:hypothetical protein
LGIEENMRAVSDAADAFTGMTVTGGSGASFTCAGKKAILHIPAQGVDATETFDVLVDGLLVPYIFAAKPA